MTDLTMTARLGLCTLLLLALVAASTVVLVAPGAHLLSMPVVGHA
jgi:hypothetical protein